MKLRIEKALYGGMGLGRFPAGESPPDPQTVSSAGKAVFVPFALPGELVEARISADRRGFFEAELDAVLESSAERVSPVCEYFPVCGGCQYQHANAGYQAKLKLDILHDTLSRAHLARHLGSILPIAVLSGPEWGYRNRIRLRVTQKEGLPQLCYFERGSHRNLPVAHCPIAAPLIQRAMAAVVRSEAGKTLSRFCQEIEFFTGSEEEVLLASLWLAPAPIGGSPARQNDLAEFCEVLRSQVPEFAGADLFSSLEPQAGLLDRWGQSSLVYSVLDRKYRVSLGSFFQVNRFLLPELLRLVTENRSGRRAWDLYAGVGLFSQALGFDEITAVEASAVSAADLKQNLAGTGHRAIQSPTLNFLRKQAHIRETPDLILVDPPRAGLGKEVCALLARIAAPELLYISCDPATLARDLQTLLQSGYHLQSMHMADLFPQTFHLETVTSLVRTRNT